jgi:hypothetical protein
MELEVKDPITGALLRLNAKPENFEGQHGYRIMHPNGSGFFIVNRSGAWRSGDDHHVEPDLLINIGLALEGGKLSDQVVHPAKF